MHKHYTENGVFMFRELLEIYLTAARVGALTFGGGYAMLPIVQREVVESKKWCTEEEVLDYYALAQCLPGMIMANTLGFVGYKRKGRAGVIAAALGAVTPSIIIISIIAMFLTAFADVPAVQNAFAGIRVCVCVLIFNSVLKMWKSSVIDWKCILIFLAVVICSVTLDFSPVAFVIVSAVLGVAIHCFGKGGADKK